MRSWLDSPEIPLLVRKGKPRGEEVVHDSGRRLVRADNSPAHWVYTHALAGNVPDLTTVGSHLEDGTIPVAMVMAAEEHEAANFAGVLYPEINLNQAEWRLCHVEQVRMGGAGPIESRDLAAIRSHFLRFLDPGNMFVIPKRWSGLGEVDEVIDAVGLEGG